MYKHSPSRNQRSKGIKVKHVLQICLLVAVVFWLIYQVKHSHDNKREFDDSAKNSLATEKSDGVIKLGRKDLNPRKEDKGIQTGKLDEEEEDEETAVEEEENKDEGMEEQDDNKTDEKEDDVNEGRGGGEEIDDPDQEKSDADNGQEVELVDDEKVRENVDELELDDKDVEDNKGQTESASTSREHYKKEAVANTRDAREENYNADDASSAVTHDTRIITTDNQTRITGKGKSTLQAELREFEHQNQSINPYESGAGKQPSVEVGGRITANGSYLTLTTTGQRKAANPTSNGTEGSKGNKNSDNSTAVRIEPRELPLPRWKMTFSELHEDEDVVEGRKNARNGSKFQMIGNKLKGNSTPTGSNDPHDITSTINTDSEDIDTSLKESKKSEEALDGTKDKGPDGINEKLDESNSETSDELPVDPIDSSDATNSLEEKLISNDL